MNKNLDKNINVINTEDPFAFDLDERVENAPEATDMNRLIEQIQRRDEVATLKEIYSKKYLLQTGLVTRKEYRTIPASTARADAYRRMQDVASLMHQVVGVEVD